MAELTYTKNGDYLVPDLEIEGQDEMEEYPLGKYGMLRQTYLKEHHHGTCTSMLPTGRLTPHLRNIDRRAWEQVDRTVAARMKRNGVNEELKTHDQMAWVQAGLITLSGSLLLYRAAALSRTSGADYMTFSSAYGLVIGAMLSLRDCREHGRLEAAGFAFPAPEHRRGAPAGQAVHGRHLLQHRHFRPVADACRRMGDGEAGGHGRGHP